MAVNTRRNSTNANNGPTITIVESADRNDKIASCCFCVPELVGVFAILLMHFFFGIFGAAASFLSLGYASDILDKVMLGVDGSLNTFIAIISALTISAIRRENIGLTRRLSIAFWILIAFLFISSITSFIADCINTPQEVNECISDANNTNIDTGNVIDPNNVDSCKQLVQAILAGEGVRVFIVGAISMYFAYVVFRFARYMKKQVIPFTIASAVPKTPTYFVYSTQPPTSTNWVPPPTYAVNTAHPLPEDFDPDSKRMPN